MTKFSSFLAPKMVLVFDGQRLLSSIHKSTHAAAQYGRIAVQAISDCCNGNQISSNGYYFRHLDPNIELDMTDVAGLKLDEYDEMCGVKREYHSSAEMRQRKRRAGRNTHKKKPKTLK